jgi:hypothetical protein
MTGLYWISRCEAMSFDYRNNLFTIQGHKVPMEDVLGRIAKEMQSDIYVITLGKSPTLINLTVLDESAADVLRNVLRDYSYAVIYNVGREGCVYFLEDVKGNFPVNDYRQEEDDASLTHNNEIAQDETTKKEKAIQRTQHFIENLKQRIESGQSDELYDRLVSESEDDSETIIHDREKLEQLEKDLLELQYGH